VVSLKDRALEKGESAAKDKSNMETSCKRGMEASRLI